MNTNRLNHAVQSAFECLTAAIVQPSKTRVVKRFASLLVMLGMLAAGNVAATTYTWDAGGGVDKSWGLDANWDVAAPGTADTAVFGAGGATNTVGAITSIVDANKTIASLNYLPLSTGINHGIQINNGVTLTVSTNFSGVSAGGGTLTIKGDSPGVGALSIGSGGLLTHTFKSGPSAVNLYTTNDFSGLGTLTVSVNTFELAGQMNVAGTSAGYLFLAANNYITATNLYVGHFSGSHTTTSYDNGYISLGQVNDVRCTTLIIGGNKGTGTMKFRSDLTGTPTLQIRSVNGTGRVTTMSVGNLAAGTSGNANGTLDATAPFSGSIDVLTSALIVGRSTDNAAKTGIGLGVIKWSNGTVDATTVVLGANVSGGTSFGNSGTLNMSGSAFLNAGTLTFGEKLGGGTVAGTLTMDGTATVKAATIQKGGAGATATYTWNSGTIQNLTGTNLNFKASDGILALNVVGAGLHTFYADSGRTITIESTSAITNNGAITKDGDGTLILFGTNTYSAVGNNGTILANGKIKIGVDSVGSVGTITSSAIGKGTLVLNGGTISSDSATARTLYNAVTFGGDITLGNVTDSGTLTFEAAGTLTGNRLLTVDSAVAFSGAIGQDTAGRALTKAGAGTLTFSGAAANTYSGLTTVSNGELDLNKTAGTDAIAGDLTISGGTAKLLAANQINNGSTVTVSGGTFDMASNNESVGAVVLSSGAITGPGTLTGTSYDVRGGTISAALAGSGVVLTKTTSGTVTLNGVNTYTGLTDIQTGTLALGADGSIIYSSVRIADGAILDSSAAGFSLGSGKTLSGNGTVAGALTTTSGSYVAPGTSIGILTNDLSGGKTTTFESGAVFNFELGAPGSGDVIAFVGLTGNQVTFNNNVINFTDVGGLAAGVYTVMTFNASSAYTETLSLGAVPGFGGSFLSYNANSIVLTVAAAGALSTISIAQIADGAEEGPVNGALEVSRPNDAAAAFAVTINYTVSGTATPNSDYTTLSGTVTMGANVIHAPIDVYVMQDNDYNESSPSETVIVTLSENSAYTVGALSNATVTITDGTKPTVSIVKTADGTEEGPTNGVFTVSRTAGETTNYDLTVSYAVDGSSSATATTDYTALTGSVIIPVGQTSATITVTVVQDNNFDEPADTIILNLSANAAYIIGDPARATMNIADGIKPVVSIMNTTDSSEEGPTNGFFTVSRTAGETTNFALTVSYTVDAASTATTNSDYTALSNSVIILAGHTTADINVLVLKDNNFNEGTETVILKLSENTADYTIEIPSCATNLIHDGIKPVVTIVKKADGSEEGPANGSFILSRPAGENTNFALTVYYTITGTATMTNDYTAFNTNLTIAVGATNATINVAVLKDTDFAEGPETVTLDILLNAAYTPGDPASATVNITDAIKPVITLIKTSDGSEYGPSYGGFNISREASATGSDVTVYIAVTGSATFGSDYNVFATNVIMAIGVTNVTIPVIVLRDAHYGEGTETVQLDMIPNGFYAIGAPNSATINIADDILPVVGERHDFTALYTFTNSVYGSVTDPTPPPYEKGIYFGSFAMVGGSKIGANGMLGTFYADGWDLSDTNQVVNRYFEVTLTPVAKVEMTLTNITFDVARQKDQGTIPVGPARWAIRSSLDNFMTNMAVMSISPANSALSVVATETVLIGAALASGVMQSGSSLSLSVGYAAITNALTLRIYGWENVGDKDGGIDNFAIHGTWKLPAPRGTMITFQ